MRPNRPLRFSATPFCAGVAFLVGCAEGPPERYRAARLEATSPEFKETIKKAETLYWNGGEEYDAIVDECKKEPALAQKLTMLMVIHMEDTASRQRQRQGVNFQLRSLDQNVPYCRARDTIAKLGPEAIPTLEELLRHPHSDKRRLGVSIVSAMSADVLPLLVEGFSTCPAKYSRYYVQAVAGMKPTPETELHLLNWSQHEDFTVRATALEGLVGFGDKHLPLLRRVVATDSDHFVQRQLVSKLGNFRDRSTANAVVRFYAGAEERGDRRGIREAERTLIKMSKQPATDGKKILFYGLAHWRKWVMTLPVDGGNR